MSADGDSHDPTNRTATTRRAVLRAAGAGAAALALGSAGAAGARRPATHLSALADAYRAPGAARAAIATHAETPIAVLSARGFLDSADPGQFDFENAEAYGLIGPDGTTARVSATTETATHEIEVGVRVASGEAYATARPTGDGDPITVRADRDGVTVRDVSTSYHCGGSHCYDLYCEEYREQLSVDGRTVTTTGDCCVCE